MFLRILEMVLPARRGERLLTFALFFHSLFAVGAFLTGRTVRDALYLAHGDRSHLAWMYVASAIGVTAAGLIYGRLATRVRRDVMALISAIFFASSFLGLWVLEGDHEAWVYNAIYVAVEVMGAMVLVQFWTLANELFNSREAKRLYGFIGAGGTFANIIIGLLSARVATEFGTPSLLILCAVLLVATALTSFAAGRLGRQRLFARAATGRPSAAKRSGGFARVFADGHLRSVALLSAVTFFTITLVDFQFKVVAADTLRGDQLAAYFGNFSAVVGVLALGLQLFGTSRLLNRAGVIGALAVLPVSLSLGNTALILFPALLAASFTKGADTLFRYSVNDATTQILYLPVQAQSRIQAKAFIDGVVKPVAIGIAGLTLAAYRQWGGGNPYRLAWLSLSLGILWIVVVIGLRSKYIRTLQDNLKQRRLDLESARHQVVDGSTNNVLARALSSNEEREVLNALALLPHFEKLTLDHKVEPLLEHPSAAVRTRALEYYAHRQTLRFANSVFRCFEDPDSGVRAAAIDAFCAMGKDKAVKNVRAYLEDPDPRIRSAAVTGMIKYGGLDGVLSAAEALKGLIAHEDPLMRAHAGKVLGNIGVKNFYQPVLQLMGDPDPRVRREAIGAAGVLRGQEFLIPLIYKTQSSDTMYEAIDALTLFGDAAVPVFAKVLSNQLEDANIRRSIARILGRLGSPGAVEVITQHLNEKDEELRRRLYRALARAVKARRLTIKDTATVQQALENELRRAYRTMHFAEVLRLGDGPGPNTPRGGPVAAKALLASAMTEKAQQIEYRIFLLLAVIFPDADMEQIYLGLNDASAADAPRRKANAVELLDNLLGRQLKQKFLPLLEDTSRAQRLESVAEFYPPPKVTEEEALWELSHDETAWVRACSLWYAATTRPRAKQLSDVLAVSSADASPVVREIALASLKIVDADKATHTAKRRITDESLYVRRIAEDITQTTSGKKPKAPSA